ncbi:MAG: hypothetical protein HQ541_17465 [Mariniphaga sp.]|nr:hypothetical protein [Mariniphaga sp.]
MVLKRLFAFLLVLNSISSFSQDFYPLKKATKSVLSALKAKNIVAEEIDITELESVVSFRTIPFVIYKFQYIELAKKGYVAFTQAKGRFENFDYLVLTDLDLTVDIVKVLKYRSEFGSEIASKKWLSQFNKYSGGALKYGDDISAISGAIFSVTSLTEDIQEVIEIMKICVQSNL